MNDADKIPQRTDSVCFILPFFAIFTTSPKQYLYWHDFYQFRSTTITPSLRKCEGSWCTASAGKWLDFKTYNFHLSYNQTLFQGWRDSRTCNGLQLITVQPCTWRIRRRRDDIYCIHSFQSRLLPPAPGWVRTSTSRSCTGRSRAMLCATCSASGAGSIVSLPRWILEL